MERKKLVRLTQRLSCAVDNLRRDTERYKIPNHTRNRGTVKINNCNSRIELNEISISSIGININSNIIRDE